ncbi:MAG TPA: ATP-binding protein [Candidatus Binatia bacterium]|nr:ATP-binding protein [Candidatus Binatia bacterium]
MPLPLSQPQENIEALTGLIGWFNQSSVELIEKYRRLEERAAYLKGELDAKHRELEASLRAREEARAYLLSVLESLKAGVLVLNRRLQPTFVNRRVTELLGDVNSERALQLLGEKLAARLRRGDSSFLPLECEKVVQGPGGVMTPVHFVVSGVTTGQPQNEYVLVFQDITTLKRLEAEAARTRRLASLGMMASEIAHQVRSPLGGIELYASLLKEKSTGDPQRLAGEILTAVQRLYTTLSHLLSFASEPTMNGDVLAVESLMKDLQAESEALFGDPRWRALFNCETGLAPLWGDRGLLAQALLNVIVNAKEAMPDGGTVSVRAQLSPFSTMNGQIHKAIEIRVSDEGTGISPENRERIFDPFFTTKAQGTGLGLAFTHKIISAHRGSIEIASACSSGTQFSVFLPAAEEL